MPGRGNLACYFLFGVNAAYLLSLPSVSFQANIAALSVAFFGLSRSHYSCWPYTLLLLE